MKYGCLKARCILHFPFQVFSHQSMEMFLVRTILPKLAFCLQMELLINPQRQEIGKLISSELARAP